MAVSQGGKGILMPPDSSCKPRVTEPAALGSGGAGQRATVVQKEPLTQNPERQSTESDAHGVAPVLVVGVNLRNHAHTWQNGRIPDDVTSNGLFSITRDESRFRSSEQEA